MGLPCAPAWHPDCTFCPWVCVRVACGTGLLQYATRSVFCLRDTNPFRKRVVWLVESSVFETFILLVIAANSIILGFADYGAVEADGNLSDTSWRNRLVNTSELYFTGIFTLEAVLKIICMGFVMSPHSYLRDGWNILDFTVVLSGCVVPGVARGVAPSPLPRRVCVRVCGGVTAPLVAKQVATVKRCAGPLPLPARGCASHPACVMPALYPICP
jgi:hypothetical protein